MKGFTVKYSFRMKDFPCAIRIFCLFLPAHNNIVAHNEGNKVVVTGSNARMLSKEMGTHLTGRYISVEVYPFSFAEYLQLERIELSQKDFYLMPSRSRLLGHFQNYLERGGFPKYLRTGSVRYLSSLYESIIFRDVMARNGLTNDKEIQELTFYLASNATKRITYNSLGKIVGIRHPETIKNYLEYIQQTYMIFQLLKYAPSVKTQMLSPKKVYFIDNAIVSRMGFNATDNVGVKLENAVFIELMRRGCDVFFHADKKECDFVVRQGVRITQAYQVTVKMDDEKTRKREIDGLQEAMDAYGLAEGYIITMNEKEELTEGGKAIHVVPAWEWMLKGCNL